MKRRDFLRNGLLAGAAIASGPIFSPRLYANHHQMPKFKLRYAPHPGMFKASAGDDIIDQIKFAADQGFTAWEDNGISGRPVELQAKIGQTLDSLGMKMGVFVAYASFDKPTFTRPDSDSTQEILSNIRNAVEVAKRVNATHFTVVPGSVDQQHTDQDKWNKYGGPRLSEGYQTANAIDMLRRCAEILEPHDLAMVLEPLNWHADHGGVFLERSDQAYAICRAVDSPACKILFDIYHQQIAEGNLIPNIKSCWSEIGYFQAGDNPGRKEPGTGEINYRNVFEYIHDRSQTEGKDFVVGMEHGNSIKGEEGEQAVIKAYRQADSY
ncbi:TIM barrel protein [Pelagicoccus sp. SDUM812002]|uniref:hydroxypyruvate isomerase family protein n=1 Tax=Pelagicoccus sp. SDUM812002 TaxID=3041266 RepID=UPI00280F198B|nr:TIM barrel protein [Pelagicoccus sp. SDUM812002]MDQ8187899.1 TIM barrel protein [Pelagicoccus sp. SDUM812002]